MDSLFQAIDWISAALVTGAVGMIAFSVRDLTVAKLIIWIVAILTVLRWGAWAMTTDSPWYLRMIVGALIGGFLATVIPASFRWIDLKAAPMEVGERQPNEVVRQYDKKTDTSVPSRHTTGILNSGKNTTMEGNHIYGHDVGIDNRGEDARIKNNDIK